MMTKKVASLILALAMCASLCVPALAVDGTPRIKNYTKEETQNYAQEYVNQVWIHEFGAQNNPDENFADAVARGSFYTQSPKRYIPDYTERKEDAFPIQEYTYDRTGQPTRDVTVTYTNSTSVEWTISGALKGTAEFNVIKTKVSAEVGIGVARSSTVGSAASSSVPYELVGGKIYSITIYAHGVDTVGAIEYYWTDIDGNSGYKTEPISALLPYASYTATNGIHFGPARVIG